MTTQNYDGRRADTPWLSPHIIVTDVDAAAEFYSRAFGFVKTNLLKGEDNTSWHGELHYHGQLIMLGKQGANNSLSKSPRNSGIESPVNLYLYCLDVDKFYRHALNAGALSLAAPENTFWGDRMCRLQDPDGYIWCFATYVENNNS